MSLAMKLVKARKAGYFQPGIARFQGQQMYSRGRAGQQGGVFGDIGKFLAGAAGSLVSGIPVIGGIVSAPLKAIAGGALDRKKKGIAASAGQPTASVASFAPTGPGMSMPTIGAGLMTPTYAPEQTYPTSTAAGPTMTNGKGSCAPSGYHWNKSGYWSNESGLLPGASWTPAGTKLVRNRHRNPYNPKAASRAMSRLASLSQGMKSLERQLTKLAPKRRSSCAGKCSTKRK